MGVVDVMGGGGGCDRGGGVRGGGGCDGGVVDVMGGVCGCDGGCGCDVWVCVDVMGGWM